MMTEAAWWMRAGIEDDAEAIMVVHRRSILGLGEPAYSPAETESWATGLKPEGYVRAMRERGEVFEVVCAGDGVIVGFCSTIGNEIIALYVDPDWARRGIASTFLERAEARIAGGGHERVVIEAALSGLNFYLARGYEVEEEKLSKSRGGLMLKAARLRKTLQHP